jgi:4a-hydroxytetrahydrobiopterin dehydratase
MENSESTTEKTALLSKQCIPCTIGATPLPPEEQQRLRAQLAEGWEIVASHHLRRTFCFDDFKAPLDLASRVGELAEAEGHHPNIYLAWGLLELTIWTHKIDGLTESDFILAAKIDALEAPAQD